MILYGIKTCDTCRKALSELRKSGREARFRDIRADPLAPSELRTMTATLGPALLNRKSKTWAALPETERAADPLDLLARHPALMKRPVIDDGDSLHLGWGAEVQRALLGDP